MHDQRRLEPRRVSISEFETMVRKYRTWHLYGPDDELGAANRVTQATEPGRRLRGRGHLRLPAHSAAVAGYRCGGITGDPDRDPVRGRPCPASAVRLTTARPDSARIPVPCVTSVPPVPPSGPGQPA